MRITRLFKRILEDQSEYWRKLLQERRIQNLKGDFANLPQSVHEEAQPVFVLSTGRAGTLLLTKILKGNPHLELAHRPEPELSWVGKWPMEEQHSQASLKAAVEAARYEAIRDAYLCGKRFVETNNRISFFAPILAELYPQSTFIHLVRRPEPFVKSGLQRGWYADSLYDEGRLPYPDLPTRKEKIAKLWLDTNEYLADFCQEHQERSAFLWSHDLFHNHGEVSKVCHRLNLGNYSSAYIKRKQAQKVNKASQKKPSDISIEELPQATEINKLIHKLDS